MVTIDDTDAATADDDGLDLQDFSKILLMSTDVGCSLGSETRLALAADTRHTAVVRELDS